MEETLILTSKENKKKYLEKSSLTLSPRKVMTFSELKEKLTFSYDERAIYEVMKETGVSYGISKLYLENLTNIEVPSSKIQLLNQLYQMLEEKGLLQHTSLFAHALQHKKIMIYGKEHLTKEEKNLLKGYSYTVQEFPFYERESYPLYILDTAEEEVYFLACQIAQLLKNKVRPKNIKIVNLDDEYRLLIEKIFAWYHIPTNIQVEYAIYGTKLVKTFLSYSSWEEGFLVLSQQVHTPLEEKIMDVLKNLVSRYSDLPQDDITRAMMREELKQVRFSSSHKEDAVEEGSMDTLYEDTDYIFLVGCNEGVLPHTYKDEDYLRDVEKEALGRMTSLEKNQAEQEKLMYFLKHTKNVTLSYKKRTWTDSYYPASFLEKIPVTHENFTMTYQDSHLVNQLFLGKMLDSYYKYNLKSPDLENLYESYPHIPYNVYDNQYTKIPPQKIMDALHQKLVLSYSSLDTYNRCSFRYYVEKVLKVDPFDRTFLTDIGTLFHYVLSKAFQKDFDFEKEWHSSIEENQMGKTKKEQFFLNKLKEELKFVIAEIQRQYGYTNLKDAFYEEKIYTHPTNEESITFMGIIDKILYNEKTHTVAVIDYKTGNPNLQLENIPYGIEMQLPIYLYLIHHFDKIPNPTIAGFYLQKILHNEVVRTEEKSYEQLKRENLLLQGYSVRDLSVLEEWDSTYENSMIIKSLRMSSKGFYAYSKVLSKREMEKMIQLVEKKIKEGIASIVSGNFSINPKRIGTDNVGCEFCTYHDLCYHVENNIVNLPKTTDLSFLGGDCDADMD